MPAQLSNITGRDEAPADVCCPLYGTGSGVSFWNCGIRACVIIQEFRRFMRTISAATLVFENRLQFAVHSPDPFGWTRQDILCRQETCENPGFRAEILQIRDLAARTNSDLRRLKSVPASKNSVAGIWCSTPGYWHSPC